MDARSHPVRNSHRRDSPEKAEVATHCRTTGPYPIPDRQPNFPRGRGAHRQADPSDLRGLIEGIDRRGLLLQVLPRRQPAWIAHPSGGRGPRTENGPTGEKLRPVLNPAALAQRERGRSRTNSRGSQTSLAREHPDETQDQVHTRRSKPERSGGSCKVIPS
jgi:hypothetical protein